MRIFLAFLTLLLACLPYGDFREYHYHRPQVPFSERSSGQANYGYQVDNEIVNSLLQSYGTAGTAQIQGQIPNTYGGNGQNYQNAGSYGAYSQQQQQQYYQQQQQQYSQQLNPFAQYTQQQNYANNGGAFGNGGFGGGHGGGFGAAGGGFGGAGFGGAGFNGGYAAGGVGVTHGGQTLPSNGPFRSQSEAGQLHSYQQQQRPVGDAVPYSREVTYCAPGGQCQKYTLAPGEPDPHHQHNAETARSKAQPTSDKCKLIAAKAHQYGYDYNNDTNGGHGGQGGQGNHHGGYNDLDDPNSPEHRAAQRPSNRRLAPYTEVTVPKDPFN